MISAETLRCLLSYDPETGLFIWRERTIEMWDASSPDRFRKIWNARYAFRNAGNLDAHGYYTLCINGKAYKAHRMAWLFIYGELPAAEVDHINGVRTDNRISNLRLATDLQNAVNAAKRSDNTSGHKGVCWHKRIGKWQAQINFQGKRKSLGYFDDPLDAKNVYDRAMTHLHGEFARAA